ncbi:MAG: MFS transporter [Candidatus Aenigmarchaeota archaeon]|nr:MFS transporter [Candidatus Aenigmarchaeota archaeon]
MNRELDELYISMALRSFALSVVGVFVPLYLLGIGLSVSDVLIYFIIYSLARFAFSAPAAKLAARYGLKKMMFASTLMIALYFILLRFAPQYGLNVNILAVLSGLSLTLFWISYHIDFAKFSKKKYVGEELGIINIITSIASFVGPFLGGLVIVAFGFDLVFTFAVIVLVLSMIPLFLSKDTHQPFSLSLKNITSERTPGDYSANVGYGMEAFTGIIWIMIIFLSITNNLASIGLVASISLIFSLMLSYASGKYTSKNPYGVLRIGVLATMFSWIIRLLVKDFFQLVVADSFYGATRPSLNIPYDAISYRKARKRIAEYIVFREALIPLGFAVVLFVALIASNLSVGIYLAALGALLLYWFRYKK